MTQRTVLQAAANALSIAGSTVVHATFGATPTNGNLLVALVTYDDSGGTATPNPNTGWTVESSSYNATTICWTVLYYKYVSGDGTSPNPDATGRGLWTCSMWEVQGVSGTWATDFQAVHLNPIAGHSTTTGTIVGFNTNSANELVLGSFACWGATPSAAITDTGVSPSVTDQDVAHGSNAGDFGTYSSVNTATFGQIATSGTSISGTFTVANLSFALQYMILELTSDVASSTETATVSMALTKIGFSAAAGRKETATTTIALSKVNFTSTGIDVKVSAAVTMVLSKIAMQAGSLVFKAGSIFNSFSTFGA